MDDLSVAKLVLISASAADGGCVPCVQSCLDEAIHLAPNLPWDEAAQAIEHEGRRNDLITAIESTRTWLASGHGPRVDEDLPEIYIA